MNMDQTVTVQRNRWMVVREAMIHRGLGVIATFRVTVILAILSLLASLVPFYTQWFELSFQQTLSGQWWRVLTGHLTHFGTQHLFWDLLMFVVLAGLCELESRRRFIPLLTMIALFVSFSVMFLCRDVVSYRGLSGIDTGLFVWFVGDQYRLSRKAGDRRFAQMWLGLGALLLGKLCFEMITGELLFVHVDGFKPLVESHVAGGLAGLVAAFLSSRGKSVDT